MHVIVKSYGLCTCFQISAVVRGRCSSCAVGNEVASAKAVRLPGLLSGAQGGEHEAETQECTQAEKHTTY